ncbi:MAG TPA: nucleotidyltransferase family protein [Trebonia sp.]|nr:nucleotidyltransferase family protein [Trebonia sp.]
MSTPFLLLDTLKKAAMVLREAGLPFALAGGVAAYARGGGLPVHDLDLVIRPADAQAAADALGQSGMRIERPPEGWLLKAFDENRMIDLIFRLAGHPDTGALLERAEEISVAAVPMLVLSATDLVISLLQAFSEHHADFAIALTIVRPLREQVDWSKVRGQAVGSPFAEAFLVLLERLAILEGGNHR